MSARLDRVRARLAAELLADPARSDRRIAELVECSCELVGLTRARLVDRGEIPAGPVVGRDGKKYAYPSRKSGPRNPLRLAIRKVARLRDLIASPEFAAGWGAATPSSRKRLAAEAFAVNTKLAYLRREA